MFFDSSYGIFIKEAAPLLVPDKKKKGPKPPSEPDGPKSDGPESPDAPERKPSDPETPGDKSPDSDDKSKKKKEKKEKDPSGVGSGLGNAAGSLFGGSGSSLKDAKDPISRLLGNIASLSEKINIPTDRLAAELGQRDRLIRQMLSFLNDENEVAKYFVDFRKKSIPWAVTADIFQECINAVSSGINFRDALDFASEYYEFHRDPAATKTMIKDAAAIQNNSRNIKVMNILKNAFRGNFSGLNFMIFGPKNIQDVMVMNRLVALALSKPSEDLYILTRQTLLDKDKATLAREIDDRIKAVFSTLASGDYYKALQTEVEFVTKQFQIIAGTPEYQNFRRIFTMLKLATEFRKQLFSSEEATETSKTDTGSRITINSNEFNYRLAQTDNKIGPLNDQTKTLLNSSIEKIIGQINLAISKMTNYINTNQKELDLPANIGTKTLIKDYINAYSDARNKLSLLFGKLRDTNITNEDFNKSYYDAFSLLRETSKKYEYAIPKSETK